MDQTLKITSIQYAQLRVQTHLDDKIREIYREYETWKLEWLISSRDAQLHVNAHSLPSMTVKKRNRIFPVSHPVCSQTQTQQSTSQFVRTESLLWNLVNTMELDAPCRGLRATAFKSLIIATAEMFQRLACTRFEKSYNHSLFDLFQHQCINLKRKLIRFKNRDEKRIEIILQCSNLLVLMYQLQFEELKAMAQHGSARTSDQRQGIGQVQSSNFDEAKEMKVSTERSTPPPEFQSNAPVSKEGHDSDSSIAMAGTADLLREEVANGIEKQKIILSRSATAMVNKSPAGKRREPATSNHLRAYAAVSDNTEVWNNASNRAAMGTYNGKCTGPGEPVKIPHKQQSGRGESDLNLNSSIDQAERAVATSTAAVVAATTDWKGTGMMAADNGDTVVVECDYFVQLLEDGYRPLPWK